MNYFQAHKLLDEVKDGRDHTTASITIALGLVGDIDSGVCGTGAGWGDQAQKDGRRAYLINRFQELEIPFPGITLMIHRKIRAMKL